MNLRPSYAKYAAPLIAASLVFACSGSSGNGGVGGDSDASAPSGDGGSSLADGGGAGTDGSTGSDAGGGGGQDSGGSTGGDAGSPPNGSSNVQIIVEPSDNGAALLSAIQGAKTSVHMTMYLLSSTNIINALIAQHNAGVDVKVLLNQTFPSGGDNSAVFAQLQSAGVNVKYAPSGFALTHEKCVVVDAKVAWIMTMNATQTSAKDNREYLAVDTDAGDVAEAEQIFEADFANTSLTPNGALVVAPNNARSKLVALANSASKTIDMEAEELSDSLVVQALENAVGRGVVVHVVLSNGTPSSSQQQAVTALKAKGVKLVSLATPYIHAKSLAVDSARAYVGSENFTTGSLNYNRELGVIVDNPTEVAKVVSTTAKDFAAGTAL